jgi:hypothetical protein
MRSRTEAIKRDTRFHCLDTIPAFTEFGENMLEAIAGLRSMVEGKQPAVGAVKEPTLKPSTGRFLTEPVKPGARR